MSALPARYGCSMTLADVSFRPPPLSTARLFLRGYEARDAPDVFAYASDEETARYMAWDRHRTLEDTRTFLDAYVASSYVLGIREYAICAREAPKRVIGGIGVRLMSQRHGTAELGYVLHRDFWGQGFVVEAARCVLERAFEDPQVQRVSAPILLENTRSQRVAEKLGFTREGVLRSAWLLRGRRWDEVRYGLLREDWQRMQDAACAGVSGR